MRHRLIGLTCVAALGACDSEPGGPGTLAATVAGPGALGAAVVEVIGSGALTFEGQGSTRAWAVTLPDEKDLPPYVRRHRVLLIGETPGALHFGIRVRDVGEDRPIVSVVQATDGENVPIVAGELEATVAPPPG